MKHTLTLMLAAFSLTALAQVDSTVFLNLCAFDSMLIGHVPDAPNDVSVTELPWLTSCSEQAGWQSLDFDDSDWNSPIHTSCSDGGLNNQLLNCGGMIDMIWASDACEVSYFRGIAFANGATQKLEMSVDNAFDLYVNDSLIHSGGPWEVCFEFDLTDILNPGPNSIAVKGIDVGDCKGMFGRAFGPGFHFGTTWNGTPSMDTQIWVHGPGEYIQEITDNSGQTEIYRFVVSSNNFQGCTDEAACNFDSNTFCDDGSCIYPAFQSDCDAASVVCGPGTVWDPQAQMCIVANPSDSNFDGCVQLNDLLDLLGAYGDCGTEEAPWQCGDPLSYQSYDYATVQIGDQCWFAENVRYLPYVTPPSNDGIRVVVYDYHGSNVEDASQSENYQLYGVLYNWPALADVQVCPNGWHIPTDPEWMELETLLGMPSNEQQGVGYRGTTEGNSLKSPIIGGTNETGFSGLGGGGWNWHVSSFTQLNVKGTWWAASQNGPYPYSRQLGQGEEGIYRHYHPQGSAFSVRCIKDND